MDVSIDEANAIRASLGMKPLPGGSGPIFKEAASPVEDEEQGSTLESRQEAGYANYQKLQEAEKKKAEREARNALIKRERDAVARRMKLTGKGLGEADGEDTDVKSWLISQKKRTKKIEQARKREKEEAEEEARRQAEYTTKDLAGVKVGHELDSFAAGDEQVLILKDTTIDENEEEGDELENIELREKERLERNLDLKKKKPVYNPNDMDESGEVRILAQYDEEISGEKKSRFTLDGQGSTAEQAEAMRNGEWTRAKPKFISLDFLKEEQPASDYLNLSETKIKKPKKKKSKSTRQKAIDEDDMLSPIETAQDFEAMDIDQPILTNDKRKIFDTSFVDDDDLQATLAATRRAVLKKRKKIRPEDIAKQVREETELSFPEDNINTGGLIIDETSEFVANLQKPINDEVNRSQSVSKLVEERKTVMNDESDDDGDVNMTQSYANVEDEEDVKARIKREEESSQVPSTGIEEEATITNGVGSALTLLRERGILKTSESGDLNAIYREKQLFLAEKQRREAEAERKARLQREKDRQNGRMNNLSAKDKEDWARQENIRRDQAESRQLAEHFNREYKPKVELKYMDEHGRNLNVKEAFKELSHQFHGKGSGKLKTEKLLKKIAMEKEREAKSLLDGSGSGGMSGVATTQTMAKKNRQAGVRLG